MVAAAIALIVAPPAGALAAAGSPGPPHEWGGHETPGEAPAESPGGPTEPAAPPAEGAAPGTNPPASTGGVPQGAGTESSGNGAAPTRRGSSLGSGSGSNQAGSTSEQPASTTASSGSYEPESSTLATVEEPASQPRAVSRVGSVEPRPAAATTGNGARAAVGAANPVAAAPVASTRDQVGSGSGVLSLPVLILCGLILVYACGRLVLGPIEPDLFRSRPFRLVRRAFHRT